MGGLAGVNRAQQAWVYFVGECLIDIVALYKAVPEMRIYCWGRAEVGGQILMFFC
jgi:hypothetical protein